MILYIPDVERSPLILSYTYSSLLSDNICPSDGIEHFRSYDASATRNFCNSTALENMTHGGRRISAQLLDKNATPAYSSNTASVVAFAFFSINQSIHPRLTAKKAMEVTTVRFSGSVIPE